MASTGRVEGGVIVFDPGEALPDGTTVRIEPIEPERGLASLSDLLLKFAGAARDLPADLAENHDHYLHGQPRR